MTEKMPLGNHAIAPEEIIPLLAQYNLIGQLLRETIIDEAIAGISCTPEEILNGCESVYRHFGLSNEVEKNVWLSRYSLNHEQLKLLATRKLRIEKFKQVRWGNKIESYFLQRKRNLDKVIYSLIQTKNQNIAGEIYFRIKEGEQTWAELASQYSIGNEAQTGGLIGPIEFGNLARNFALLLYTSQVGVVQAPIPIGENWVILRVEKFIAASLDNFMRQRLLNELFDSWLNEQCLQLPDFDKAWMGITQKVVPIKSNLVA